jgi:outer membrane protein assembly factor BamE (lipoprotein component of BamABCDE complex)
MRVNGRLVLGIAGATALTMLAGGCASIKDHRGYLVDSALVDSVQIGVDNKISVERALGRPTFTTQWGEPAWYYVSIDTKQAAFTRPKANQQLIMRVRFDPAGNVVAIDRAGMEKVAQLDPNGHKTPTLGRDRSFIEDLFGNIGTVGAPGAAPSSGGGGGTGPNGS